MIDMEKFRLELLEEVLQRHPKMKSEDSMLAPFAKLIVEIAANAIAKYDRENSHENNPQSPQ